jgi:hypothetical protein
MRRIPEIHGVCELAGAVTIAPDAVAYWRGEPIGAEIFNIADQVVAFVIPGGSADSGLADAVRRGTIAARPDIDEGMLVGVQLYQSGNPAATVWPEGLHEFFVPFRAQRYLHDFAFCRVAAQLARGMKGAGQPLEIRIAGNIGDQHGVIVDQVRAAHGRDRSIIVDPVIAHHPHTMTIRLRGVAELPGHYHTPQRPPGWSRKTPRACCHFAGESGAESAADKLFMIKDE